MAVSMFCKYFVFRVATDSLSLVVFPLTNDSSLVVDSVLDRVALLLFLFLIVLSVHAFGVDVARHVDFLGVDAALSYDVAFSAWPTFEYCSVNRRVQCLMVSP